MQRAGDSPELLDGPLDRRTLAGNLRDLSRVNRCLGGAALSSRALHRLAIAKPWTSATLLDVGTGGADIPAYLLQHPGGLRVRVTATDVRDEIVELARQAAVDNPDLEVRLGKIEDESDDSFDVVHASLVLHHLEPDDALDLLCHMGRVARDAVIVNDLDRGRLWLAGAWLLSRLFTRNRYTRNDAPLSVRRAYGPDELTALASRAGLREIARYATRPGYRYALVFAHDSG